MTGTIIGNQNPLVGTTYTYEIKPSGLSFGLKGDYEWYLYKKQKNGSWKDITGKPKTGEKVTYNFGEIALGIEFQMKVYETKKGLLPGLPSTRELAGSCVLIPTSNKVPKIDKVVLFNRGAKDVNKASYRDTLIAQAHCIAMFNKEIEFHLWEDDAPGKGHDASINKNNRHTRSYKARVNEKGIAEVSIPLMSDEKILRQMANQFLMKGDRNEGANHEYYVTATYSGQIQGASQVNVDVANPDYKGQPQNQPKPKPQPEKHTPKFPAGQGGGPKQPDPKGNIIEAVFIDDTGKELSKVGVGDKVRVRIHSKNMVEKHIQYVVWEYDTTSNDEVYRSGNIKIPADVCDTSGFVITKDIFGKGIDSPIGDPDSDTQNYFIEIISKDLSAESQKFGVNSEGLMQVEKVKSAAGVQKTQDPKPENGKCPNCEKDITLEQIKSICVSKKNKNGSETCLIKDDSLIKAALPFLNSYRKKADINTCITKAHFIAQLCQESKFYDLQEAFRYRDPERMRKLFFSYFKQFGSLEKQRAEAKRLSDLSLDSKNWKTVANAIYGKTHPNGKNNTDKDDGWRYSGKGFKQITWRDNYLNIQKTAKNIFEKNVTWVDNDNPYKLVNSSEDSMLSALAFWKRGNISGKATEISDEAVTNVTSLVNPALVGLDERKRFFKKAVEILQVDKCKPKGKVNNAKEDGTVVVVSGTDTKIENDAFKPTEFSWKMYKTSVYKDMSLNTYYNLEKNNKLPEADYVTYLSRDTHQTSTSKGKILKHSDKRFGTYNEIPPGEYYLVPGVSGQKYKIYVIDSESKSAAAENGIDGPDGTRGGVALHHYTPRFSVGCFTFNSGNDTSPVQKLIDNLPDLPLNDKKPVRFIVKERKVKESTWSNSSFGTKKWTGI
ncbi:glycoside hydrolase family 19 protein [Chryseobacterium cucumeris]|uniref:glycoside hydrolase family 19 protein n=1 Tax=Chryseobacterium cucumeris TaxID=1813611 RepID=UPI003D966BCA